MMTQMLGGRYQIVSHLSGGGFGTTFVACDTQLPGNPLCVVKQLKPQTTGEESMLQTARRLFNTEAQVLYQLGTHDQIPQLLAYFEENQEFYLVQEFIKGNDLSHELIPGKQLGEEQVTCLLQDILEILEFVHQQKVIHRDVNPRNLIRRESDNKLVLIDFGAVKQITTQRSARGGSLASVERAQLIAAQRQTKMTVAIGTPGYVPGEQAHGNPKLSSDVYAVGIIGIQALTGLQPEQLPKDTDTDEICWHQQAQVSSEFAKVLDKMVRYDFRQRYSSASEALLALKELKNPIPHTVVLPPPHRQKTPKRRLKSFPVVSVGLIGLGILASIYLFNTLNSTNAAHLYKQGNTLYELKRYKEALNAFDKAIQLSPESIDAWNGEGKTLYQLKRYKEALNAFDKAIQLNPESVDSWSGRAGVLEDLQQYQAAIDSFNRALKIQPNDSEMWNDLGDALMNLQRYPEAITSYEKAVQFKPDYYQAWSSRGWALHNLQRYEDAVASFDKAVQSKPDYYQAWYSRGNAFVALQRYPEALDSYEKAVQFKPDYYQAWYSRGNALMALQRYPEALDSFNKAVQLQPEAYKSWESRGWVLHQLQRYAEAITSYDQAIQLKRNNYQVWYNRGNALYNMKRYEEAIASYNRAVRYKPDDYEAWYSRGNALFNLKRYTEAITSFNKALLLKPDYREAMEAVEQAKTQMESEKPKDEKPNLMRFLFGDLLH